MNRQSTNMLNFRAPALVDGRLTYLSGKQFLGRVAVICFLPYPGIVAAGTLDRQTEEFRRIGVGFLIAISGARPFHRAWNDQEETPRTPVMADPCGRLHRMFGVVAEEPSPRCRTFVIDGGGVLRLRFTHGFIDHDLAAIRHLVALNRLHLAEGVPSTETEMAAKGEYLPV